MDKSGKRLGVAMLTVVVVLGLNALAVLSGAADGTYSRLFGYQPDRDLVATRAETAAPEPVSSATECAQSRPKRPYPRSLVAVAGTHSNSGRVARMC